MADFPKTILSPIVDSIVQKDDLNAFLIGEETYSFREFGRFISSVRMAIDALGADEKVFALAIHDDIYTYASIIALWMEGKAYVPLHPNQPMDRNVSILEQVGTGFVLDSNNESEFSNSYRTICTSKQVYSEDYLNNWADASDDDLAYILFTSGSTGTPKGVPISRGNLSAFIDSFWDLGYQLSDQDRCLQCFDLTFDLSVMSYLIPLLVGACIYTVPYDKVKWSYIYYLLEKNQITFAMMTPSTIQYLRPYFTEISLPQMRYSMFAGEALPTSTLNEWADCVPNARIDNAYGPTEDTIFCTIYRYLRDGANIEHNGVLSIGKTVKNVQAIIVDESNKVIEVEGELGELCLSGKQLTNGYWNNSSLNRGSFWTSESGTRYYHTGDLCCYGEDRNILFVGRKDSQVKINGYRIELSEIEFHARSFLNKNVVVLSSEIDGRGAIVMFVEREETDNEPLLSHLRTKLPPYMIPNIIINEPLFPVNNSNKIDRNKLKLCLK